MTAAARKAARTAGSTAKPLPDGGGGFVRFGAALFVSGRLFLLEGLVHVV